MSAFAWLLSAAQEQVQHSLGVAAPFGAPVLAGALAFSAGFYVYHRRVRGRPASLRHFLRTIFAARIVLHPSSLVDMRMWLLNGLVFSAGYGLLAAGMAFWRDETLGAVSGLFGAHEASVWPTWGVLALATVLLLLAHELAYWFGHFLFHRIPALWEFHKVHHSAEVMTTLTTLRQHPVEILAFMNLISLATGVVLGCLSYAFGAGVSDDTFAYSLVLLAFLATYGHLRHSHLWIAFTGLPGKLLQSPAHHQIHHSDNPAHWDKNLGFSLALYDWMFGTLYIPAKAREPITFGVGVDNPLFRSTTANFIAPFGRFGHEVARALHGEAAPTPAAAQVSPPQQP